MESFFLRKIFKLFYKYFLINAYKLWMKNIKSIGTYKTKIK